MIEGDAARACTERRGPFEIVNTGYPRRRPRNVQAIAARSLDGRRRPTARPARVALGAVDLRLAAPMLATPWQAVVQGGHRDTGGLARREPARRPAARFSRGHGCATGPLPARIVVDARRIAAADTADPVGRCAGLPPGSARAIAAGPPTFGGPLQALLRRRGDSSDRAELFVAMAQRLGIPARQVVGLLSDGGRAPVPCLGGGLARRLGAGGPDARPGAATPGTSDF